MWSAGDEAGGVDGRLDLEGEATSSVSLPASLVRVLL